MLVTSKSATETRNFSLNMEYKFFLDQFEPILQETGDQYLTCITLEEVVQGKYWTIIFTDQHYYKFVLGSSLAEPRTRKDLREIHSVEIDRNNPRSFIMRSYKYKTKMAVSELGGWMGIEMDYDSFLQIRRWVCATPLEAEQLVWLINKAVCNLWQRTFEYKLIPEPENYVKHSWVIKVNANGKTQERVLVLSDVWLYNIEVTHNPVQVKSLKWAVPLRSLSVMTLGPSNMEFGIYIDDSTRQMMLDQTHGGSKKHTSLHNQHTFYSSDEEQRNGFVKDISRSYYRLMRLELPIERKAGTKSKVGGHGGKEKTEKQERDKERRGSVKLSGNSANNRSMTGQTMMKTITAETEPIIKERLYKFKSGGGRQLRFVSLYPSGIVKWGVKEMDYDDYPASEHVTSVALIDRESQSIREQKLSAAEQRRFFSLHTTGKTLMLLCPTPESCHMWVKVVNTVLEKRRKTTRNNDISTELSPILQGYFTKYTKDGRSKHEKYVCLYSTGLVTWGDTPKKAYKYAEQLLAIETDASVLGKKRITGEEALRFFSFDTTGKAIHLLASSPEVAQRWIHVAEEIIMAQEEEEVEEEVPEKRKEGAIGYI